MTRPPERRKRLSQQRAEAIGVTRDDLSIDPVHLQNKLHQKSKTITALDAKIKRMEKVLRDGGTWEDYQADEGERAMARDAARAERMHGHG